MNIVTIPLDRIDVGQRLRPVDEDYAQLIAASMAEQGPRSPIEVRPERADGMWPLIAGAHRLRAAFIAGLSGLPAIVKDVDDLGAELLEIDENLFRHDLKELDRAAFLARRKEIHEALYPETKHGGDRRSDQVDKFDHLSTRFTQEAAEKLGLSERTVRRAVARFTRIAPDVRTMLAGTWLADHGGQLDALVKLGHAEQRKVAKLLLRERDPLPNVATALRQIKGVREPARDVDQEQYQKLLGAWRKSGAKARRLFVDHLVDAGEIDAARRAA